MTKKKEAKGSKRWYERMEWEEEHKKHWLRRTREGGERKMIVKE